MDGSQEPLAAGLLTALASSLVPTPTSMSYSDSLSAPLPSPTSNPGHNHGGEKLREWSSLIGIITALVGNVLISLALNIQRYAHIRIAREWEHEKIRMEADWKRAHSDNNTTGPYGAVAGHGYVDDEEAPRGRSRHSYERYRDESPDYPPQHRSHGRRDEGSESHDNLRQSFQSDQTALPGDKNLQRKSYLKSPYWWVGIILMCIGETGNFMAYGFAPASIVSPLGVVALISNCVVAPCMLKEKFRSRDFWGVLVAIAGAVVVVLSAKSSEEKIGPHEIWSMITTWEFELYLGLTGGLIVALMWMSGKYGPQTILIDVGLVALYGGYTALSTKGVSSLLSFKLWHIITFPITYLLVFVLVFSALMQIRYINKALQRFDSTQVIPTQFVLFTLSVIIGSAVLYRDFESYTASRAGKFVGGCLLTFLGVYFITSGRVSTDDESTYSADDEEEAIGLLSGDHYHDRIDMSPPGHQFKAQQPAQKTADPRDEGLESPSGSLFSHGIEDIDDGQATPRGVLSAVPSSPAGSLTAASLTASSPDRPSSPPAPNSLITNPWAESYDQFVASKSQPQISRPVTPPGQSSHTTVLLRFPQAPGVEDQGQRPRSPSGADRTQPAEQNRTVPETPPTRRLPNPLSARFSPGPFLPTLSAGFSAVVAESLRRGEGSPAKERKNRHRMSRSKQLSTTIVDGFLRDRASAPGPAESGPQDNNSPFNVATSRLHSAVDLPLGPATAGNSTPALAREGSETENGTHDIASLNRLRSLSDSVSGGLAWLGGNLRKPNKPQRSVSAIEGEHFEPHDEGEEETGENARP